VVLGSIGFPLSRAFMQPTASWHHFIFSFESAECFGEHVSQCVTRDSLREEYSTIEICACVYASLN
jgi:hypothetical protein